MSQSQAPHHPKRGHPCHLDFTCWAIKVNDRSQPPMTFHLSLGDPAGCGWSERPGLLPCPCLPLAVPVARRVSSLVLPVPTAAHIFDESESCPLGCAGAAEHPPDWP